MHCSRRKAFLAIPVLFLTSCSQPPKPPAGETKTAAQEASQPAGPVSGKTALWEIYKSARNWSKDLAPLALESQTVAGVTNEGGKAGMWKATFGSVSKQEARYFTYSVVGHPPDVYKGTTIGKGVPWSGPTRDALTFQASEAELAIDSDAAFKTASAQAASWLKQHPDKEATISLGNAARFPGAVWYVHWGDKKSGYAVYVNAKTGEVVK
jgi:hypothetical protein